jgi:hypothetical protein
VRIVLVDNTSPLLTNKSLDKEEMFSNQFIYTIINQFLRWGLRWGTFQIVHKLHSKLNEMFLEIMFFFEVWRVNSFVLCPSILVERVFFQWHSETAFKRGKKVKKCCEWNWSLNSCFQSIRKQSFSLLLQHCTNRFKVLSICCVFSVCFKSRNVTMNRKLRERDSFHFNVWVWEAAERLTKLTKLTKTDKILSDKNWQKLTKLTKTDKNQRIIF